MRERPFFILLDVVFVLLYVIILAALHYLGRLPRHISTMDLVLLGLATARLADIISTDEIMRWLREPFVKTETEEMGGEEVITREGRGRGFRKVFGDLLSCPWCVAVWVAAGLTYAFALWPVVVWLFVLLIALAEIGSILQTFSTILVRAEKYFKKLGVSDDDI